MALRWRGSEGQTDLHIEACYEEKHHVSERAEETWTPSCSCWSPEDVICDVCSGRKLKAVKLFIYLVHLPTVTLYCVVYIININIFKNISCTYNLMTQEEKNCGSVSCPRTLQHVDSLYSLYDVQACTPNANPPSLFVFLYLSPFLSVLFSLSLSFRREPDYL